MINIESERWKVVSFQSTAIVTNKETGDTRYVELKRLPSAQTLALLHETAFNREISKAFKEGEVP
ncbi:hypothetical protein EVB27_090 [Rhizobium phage RHph_TM16]|nr:hypothetical protein EVB27_090 [Rhizobium phage RHph_TM16]